MSDIHKTKSATDFLFELGCEELPHQYIEQLITQLTTNVATLFAQFRIEYSAIHHFATARRLAFVVSGLATKQQDLVEQKLGPWINQAYNAQGEPTQALVGFARSCGVSPSELTQIEINGKQRLAVTLHVRGKETRDLLPTLLPQLLARWKLPSAMTWGKGEHYFVRPVRWLCTLLGEKHVPFYAYGIDSSCYTFGHRCTSESAILVSMPSQYEHILAKALVIADANKRKQSILDQIQQLLIQTQLRSIATPSLIDELVGLVEYPVAILGKFSEDYLRLPREVLITTIEKHQRYINLEDEKGNISNRFIVISNAPNGDSSAIVHGNEQVLRPRLGDATFFWQRDCELGIANMSARLHEVVFEAKLGSMADKTTRITNVSSFLADQNNCEEKAQLMQAASYAKADLLSQMVREFPELQGIVGGYLAKQAGYGDTVASIIGQHYLPVFDGDTLPKTPAAKMLALADKLDHLCGVFLGNKQGSAQSDQFGARRASLGIVQLLLALENRKLSLSEIIYHTLGQFGKDSNQFFDPIHSFIMERAHNWFVRAGFSSQIIQSILAKGIDNLVEIHCRTVFLTQNMQNANLHNLGQLIKRIRNIRKGYKVDLQVDEKIFSTDQERDLWTHYQTIRKHIQQAMDNADYAKYVALSIQLQQPLSDLFDNVMITKGSEQQVTNRIQMLFQIEKSCCQLADVASL